MNEACLGEVPEGYEALTGERARALFQPEWVELVYVGSLITTNQHERFDADGNYGLIGGRVPYVGTYRLDGPLLTTSIPGGPEFHRRRTRLLLSAGAAGEDIHIHECGIAGSVSAVRFVREE